MSTIAPVVRRVRDQDDFLTGSLPYAHAAAFGVSTASANNAAALQAAVDYLYNNYAGGTVLLGYGSFKLGAAVDQKNGVTIKGMGRYATTISRSPGYTGDYFTATGAAAGGSSPDGNRLRNLGICDLKIDGGGIATRAVYWRAVTESLIARVGVYNMAGDAIELSDTINVVIDQLKSQTHAGRAVYAHDATNILTVRDARISDCDCNGGVGGAVEWDGPNSYGLTVIGGSIESNGLGAAGCSAVRIGRTSNTDAAQILGVHFENNKSQANGQVRVGSPTGSGLQAAGAVTIANCHFTATAGGGTNATVAVKLERCQNVNLVNNESSGHTTASVDLGAEALGVTLANHKKSDTGAITTGSGGLVLSTYNSNPTLSDGNVSLTFATNVQFNSVAPTGNLYRWAFAGTDLMLLGHNGLGLGEASPGPKLHFVAATAAAGGIRFGDAGCNLYRVATNILKTDQSFQVAQNFTVLSGKLATNSGTTIGFFGVTGGGQQTGGALTAGGTYTANEQDMLQKAYSALRTFGLLS